MKWRAYNDIIDKLCAWFLYQQISQELHDNKLDNIPDTQRVMQYMQQLCVSSASCSLRASQNIWDKRLKTRGISSCLEYLATVVKPTVFQTLMRIVSTHMTEPCLNDYTLSQFRIISANNSSWRIIRKNSGNKLMFFRNDDDHIHVTIPGTWSTNQRNEIYISFDENDQHYRYYRSVMLRRKKEFWYSYGKTVVVRDQIEHATRFTQDQHVQCSIIFICFKLLHDDLSLWMYDETNKQAVHCAYMLTSI
jgi:hypothetical protein